VSGPEVAGSPTVLLWSSAAEAFFFFIFVAGEGAGCGFACWFCVFTAPGTVDDSGGVPCAQAFCHKQVAATIHNATASKNLFVMGLKWYITAHLQQSRWFIMLRTKRQVEIARDVHLLFGSPWESGQQDNSSSRC